MLRGLVVLFVLVPAVELYLLTLLVRATSFWVAVTLALGTGVLGGTLAKREGLRVWRRWQEALQQGRVPDEGVIGGVLVLVGGVLLISPGVLTDVVGLLLLIPVTRRFVAERIRRRVDAKFGGLSTSWASGAGFPGGVPRSVSRAGAIDTSGTSLDP
jgi:UPF0716 protein FxsA